MKAHKKVSNELWQAATRYAAFALICFALQGCGVTYHENASRLAATGRDDAYGPMPTGYEAAVTHFFTATFARSPDDVTYANWKTPFKAIIPSANLSTVPIQGWQVDVHIGTRSDSASDVVLEKYSFFFVNNEIYAYRHSLNVSIWWNYTAN